MSLKNQTTKGNEGGALGVKIEEILAIKKGTQLGIQSLLTCNMKGG